MKIYLTSVLVDDQEKALRFYTDVLGFVKKQDVPIGEHRWLTVVSPEAPDGVELLLEPDEHPRRRRSRRRWSRTASRSRRSRSRRPGRVRPAAAPASLHPGADDDGPGRPRAVFDDTCGNLIQIASMG